MESSRTVVAPCDPAHHDRLYVANAILKSNPSLREAGYQDTGLPRARNLPRNLWRDGPHMMRNILYQPTSHICIPPQDGAYCRPKRSPFVPMTSYAGPTRARIGPTAVLNSTSWKSTKPIAKSRWPSGTVRFAQSSTVKRVQPAANRHVTR